MDIHHLRVFASVFKNKSFSKASMELHLSQPTVSDHIKSLEEELRCRLFDRLSREIIPTNEAFLLIGKALEVIEKFEGIKDLLNELREDLTGHLMIGASTIPGTYILPELTSSFRREHPSVFFEIIVSDSQRIVDKVSEHDLIIGIVGAKLEARHIQYTAFLDDELIAIGAPRIAKHSSIHIGDLTEIPMIIREKGSGTRREFEKILEGAGFDIHHLSVVGIFGSTDAVKQAAKEGMGIAIVSRRSVRDELKCNILKEIKITDVDMKRQFYIITHMKRTLPHLYKTFFEYLLLHQ